MTAMCEDPPRPSKSRRETDLGGTIRGEIRGRAAVERDISTYVIGYDSTAANLVVYSRIYVHLW